VRSLGSGTVPGKPGGRFKIGQLTDVSQCNLQKYLRCNRHYQVHPSDRTPWTDEETMNTMAPTRPALQCACRIPLTASPAAAAVARRQVQAVIRTWDVPVDADDAVLLTSELVTNAIRHVAGHTIWLAITCAGDRFRVDVQDSSYAMPAPVAGPADAETGRGLTLVASLSAEWGCYPTPAGKAVYFALAYQADPQLAEDGGRGPRRDRSWVR
jgi:anti-sigma regulatory factor (Ser/Thr protein kinase)